MPTVTMPSAARAESGSRLVTQRTGASSGVRLPVGPGPSAGQIGQGYQAPVTAPTPSQIPTRCYGIRYRAACKGVTRRPVVWRFRRSAAVPPKVREAAADRLTTGMLSSCSELANRNIRAKLRAGVPVDAQSVAIELPQKRIVCAAPASSQPAVDERFRKFEPFDRCRSSRRC